MTKQNCQLRALAGTEKPRSQPAQNGGYLKRFEHYAW